MRYRAGKRTSNASSFVATLVAALVTAACDEGSTGSASTLDAGTGAAATTTGGASSQAGGATNSGGATQNGGSRSDGGSANAGSGGVSTGGANGGSGTGGASNGGAGGSGTGGAGGSAHSVSGLPVPPGPGNQPRPMGTVANLAVVPWAGFASALTYTFDDSSPSQVDHFAEIDAAGVPVTFYLTTNNSWYAGYEATWKAALAAGHELANHTVHHCNFDQACSGAAAGSAVSEIDDATSYIEGTLGAPDVWTMAYPFGDTGYESLAKERFFLARGVPGGTVKPGDTTDPWNLPIYGAQGGEDTSALVNRIDAARAEGSWLIFLFHSLAPNSEAWYAPVDVASVTGSIDHAKSAGDTWIDTLVSVGAYWLGERLIEQATPSSTPAGQVWTWSVPKDFPPGKFVRVVVDGGELSQNGSPLEWNGHGFYEVALDRGELTWK